MSASVLEAQAEIEGTLGARVASWSRLPGGDVNLVSRVELSDGRRIVIKSRPDAPEGFFDAESRGLSWIAAAGALRVPTVLASGRRWLALEFIERGARAPDYEERLGRGLAKLHASAPATFGLDTDNYLATLPQANEPTETWAEFYRDRRLEPLMRQAVAQARIDASMALRLAAVLARIEQLCGPDEPPARLHGDLWAGNVIEDEHGAPVLIDPAVYGGHREVDLAMMRLFGGFGRRVFEAYEEQFPLAPDAPSRVPLYQLLPLLVHVLLFGGGYVGQLDGALRAIGA